MNNLSGLRLSEILEFRMDHIYDEVTASSPYFISIYRTSRVTRSGMKVCN
jgi:hypothetical protein